ncbi:GntR family transcriptional regulator [Streptomyces sp. TR02-1]|uniref:GntR family transcriptional regulator n=1 Tax=Streptomyces sp. TR02-1 TaxID=3385977 RepID=UPI0039A21E77
MSDGERSSSLEGAPIRHEVPQGYSMTPLWVIVRCRKEVWLYDFLRARYGGMEATFPGIKTVAEEMGVSRRTVENALSRLKDAGAVAVINRTRDDGSRTTNEYRTYFYPPEQRER